MKKNRVYLKAAAVVLIIGIGILTATCLIRVRSIEKLKEQQNYMASRLIEMGAYEQGRILAIQNNQMKENEIAQELIVLAAGFQADYASGIRNAEEFLKEKSDEILQESMQLYQKCLSEIKELPSDDELAYQEEKQKVNDRIFEGLMALLFRIENKIHTKVDNETLQIMLEIMASSDMVNYEALELLQKDDSLLSVKVQVSSNLQSGNYINAFENAKTLYEKDPSFENKALLDRKSVV